MPAFLSPLCSSHPDGARAALLIKDFSALKRRAGANSLLPSPPLCKMPSLFSGEAHAVSQRHSKG